MKLKKRTFQFLICFTILLCALANTLQAQALGDVNNDNKITITDSLLVAQFYIGLDPRPFYTSAADVNCDGSINIVDAMLIAQYYIKIIDHFCDNNPTPTETPLETPTPGLTAKPTPVVTQPPGAPRNLIRNFSFEDNQSISQAISGWQTESFSSEADKCDFDWASSGDYRLSHWLDRDYKVSTFQDVVNIIPGHYQFQFAYTSGGGQKALQVILSEHGGNPVVINLGAEANWTEHQLSGGIEITSGRCRVTILSDAYSGNWASFDDVALYFGHSILAFTYSGSQGPLVPNRVANFSFEDDKAEVQGISGWQTEASLPDADKTEMNWTHSGEYKLTHWMGSDYKIKTYQNISNLEPGRYQFQLSYASSGGQKTLAAVLSEYGGNPVTLSLGAAEGWTEARLNGGINITSGQCRVDLYSDAYANNWVNWDDVALYKSDVPLSGYVVESPSQIVAIEYVSSPVPLKIVGADVSSLQQAEETGNCFFDVNGEQKDLLEILADHGFNYVRARTWHSPADGYLNKERIVQLANRVKAAGLNLLLDIHYSDSWADPGKQNKPAAWVNLGYPALKQAVYDYTYDLLSALKSQNTLPAIVQVGNEIRAGMLWPDGSLDHWSQFTDLLKTGISAVRAVAGQNTRVMIHSDTGGDNAQSVYFYDQIQSYGVDYDIIGLSYYSFWHGPLSDMYTNFNDLATRYNKDILMAEVSFPYTLENSDGYANIISDSSQLKYGYTATTSGQVSYLTDLLEALKRVRNGRCLGMVYWEPAWPGGISWDPADHSAGNAWENMGLFDFGNRALNSITLFEDSPYRQ